LDIEADEVTVDGPSSPSQAIVIWDSPSETASAHWKCNRCTRRLSREYSTHSFGTAAPVALPSGTLDTRWPSTGTDTSLSTKPNPALERGNGEPASDRSLLRNGSHAHRNARSASRLTTQNVETPVGSGKVLVTLETPQEDRVVRFRRGDEG